MTTAEDIASETFLAAVESWQYNGVPPNPVAWLYAVARNKAVNHFKKERKKEGNPEWHLPAVEESDEMDLSEENISDSQLKMLFAVCHPSIPKESQVGLALRILCGFGIDEIAEAFLTSRDTVNKRLYRAREKLRQEKVPIELPSGPEIATRLDAVLLVIYLLFNEGYHVSGQDMILRKDLCLEAMRLTQLLLHYPPAARAEVNALMALMCFQTSRFEARQSVNGDIILYEDQDESLWNEELIARGAYFLHQAATGDKASRYHLEAGIAYWYTRKTDTEEKWRHILSLYNELLIIEYSPVAALNRTYVLSKVKGKEEAIREAEKLSLTNNHFYYALLGELYTGVNNEKAVEYLLEALGLARSAPDKRLMMNKLMMLDHNIDEG